VLDLQNDEEMDVQNLVLAQFEKVTRAKSKWKCILKEGTMTLKGKDSLFGKAGGEFTW
jgi:transcription initiation factor TFIIA large subunit